MRVKYRLFRNGVRSCEKIIKSTLLLKKLPEDIGDLRNTLLFFIFLSNILISLVRSYCFIFILKQKLRFEDILRSLIFLNQNIMSIQLYYSTMIYMFIKKSGLLILIQVTSSFIFLPIVILIEQQMMTSAFKIHIYEIYLVLSYYVFLKNIKESYELEEKEYELIKHGFIFVQIAIFYIYKVNFYTC